MKDPFILIIEDEPKVASFIKKGLEENSYEAEIAFDGYIGRKMALANEYDLIILDVNIPLLNGFEVCKEVRMSKPNIPILMLTAMSSTEDKLIGFDAGVDDYLVKPFEFRELLARIKVLLKRKDHSGITGNSLKLADLVMNMESRVVTRNDKKIELTSKEYSLLEYLLKNKGRVISRSELAEKIWDITFDTGTNVIDVYINFLRKKIDKDSSVKLIHTHFGIGYVLKDSE